MTDPARKRHDLKDRIMADPEVILEDPDLMRALLAADAARMGDNIVDLRGLAMDRLEARLGRLEDTHRSVIAAAYENLAGTNQVHRAVLSVLEPHDFAAFMHNLGGDVAAHLQVDAIRLVLETDADDPDPKLAALDEVLCVVPRGRIDTLIGTPNGLPPRRVTLQPTRAETAALYSDAAPYIGSEALLRLEFGDAHLPGLLALGAEDAAQFTPSLGTDLLSFFAKVVERAILRWIV